MEFQTLVNHFGLIKHRHPFLDNLQHQFFHHPYIEFSRLGPEIPHSHLKFHLQDRLLALRQICDFLTVRQAKNKLRKKDYRVLLETMNKKKENAPPMPFRFDLYKLII